MISKSSKTVCIDANIPVCLAIGGPYRKEIRQKWGYWQKNQVNLIAPPLFAYEVTSAIWRYVYLGKVSNQHGLKALKAVFAQSVQLKSWANIHHRAWEIARKFNLPQTYDAHYLALAEHFGCEFWTADRKLHSSLASKLSWVHTIPENN